MEEDLWVWRVFMVAATLMWWSLFSQADAHSHFHECNRNQRCCAWYVTGATWRWRGLAGWEETWTVGRKEGQCPELWSALRGTLKGMGV